MKQISLKGMSRNDWLKLRRQGIGGSDVAAILGLSKWKTPLDVFNDKTGESAPEEQEDNASMEWGRRLEPVIRDKYAEATGFKVAKPDLMLVSDEHPFMIADVDGIAEDGRILECKTARTARDWGEEGMDEIPEYYQTQVQHYMAVTGAAACDVAVLIGGSDFRIYTVKRDQELIDILIKEESKFWNEHVVPGIAPSPMTLAETESAYPASNGQSREASPEIESDLSDLVRAEREMNEAKSRVSELRAKVQAFMGENEKLLLNGTAVATWKSSKPRVTFDSKAFGAAEPELYKQYLKEGAPVRRFTVKASFADSIA